jgi:hypothetical protein
MAAKIALAVTLLPWAGYLAEAGLLSGYFVVTVGLIVWRGLREVGLAEGSTSPQADRLPGNARG